MRWALGPVRTLPVLTSRLQRRLFIRLSAQGMLGASREGEREEGGKEGAGRTEWSLDGSQGKTGTPLCTTEDCTTHSFPFLLPPLCPHHSGGTRLSSPRTAGETEVWRDEVLCTRSCSVLVAERGQIRKGGRAWTLGLWGHSSHILPYTLTRGPGPRPFRTPPSPVERDPLSSSATPRTPEIWWLGRL